MTTSTMTEPTTRLHPRWPWQVAAAFGLAHVVLVFVGIALQQGPLFVEGADGIRERYVEGSFSRSVTGGIAEAFGFVLFLATLVFLARMVGRRTEVGRWAAQTGLMCGVGYVAVTFAVGFPAGAAAMYGAQHGLDVETAFALNNVRLFGYFLSLLLLAGSTVGIAVSAIVDGWRRRWVGYLGLVTGAVLVASTPLTAVNLQDPGTLLWMVWFVGVCISLMREPATDRAEGVPSTSGLGHA